MFYIRFFFSFTSKITGGRTGGTTGNTQVHPTPTLQPSDLKGMHIQQHVKKTAKVKYFQALIQAEGHGMCLILSP